MLTCKHVFKNTKQLKILITCKQFCLFPCIFQINIVSLQTEINLYFKYGESVENDTRHRQ